MVEEGNNRRWNFRDKAGWRRKRGREGVEKLKKRPSKVVIIIHRKMHLKYDFGTTHSRNF